MMPAIDPVAGHPNGATEEERGMSEISQNCSDIWIGGGLLAFCAFAAWRTLKIRAQASSTIAGPAFLPWIMIFAIAILSVWLILRAMRSKTDQGIEMPDRATLINMGLFALLLVGYAAAFMPLGYIPTTLVTIFLGLWLFGERNWLVLTLFPVAMTAAVYLGFTHLLNVWLP